MSSIGKCKLDIIGRGQAVRLGKGDFDREPSCEVEEFRPIQASRFLAHFPELFPES